MINILMNKIKINLLDFIRNPTGAISDYHIRQKSLEELQPIIVISGDNGDTQIFVDALKQKGVEFYVDPNNIEKPVRGYVVDLNNIELVY